MLRDYSRLCVPGSLLEGLEGTFVVGLNPGWPCTRPVLSLSYSLSSPILSFLNIYFFFLGFGGHFCSFYNYFSEVPRMNPHARRAGSLLLGEPGPLGSYFQIQKRFYLRDWKEAGEGRE